MCGADGRDWWCWCWSALVAVLWRVGHLHCTYTDAMVNNVRSWGGPGGPDVCVLFDVLPSGASLDQVHSTP